jgi:hypothetical protein
VKVACIKRKADFLLSNYIRLEPPECQFFFTVYLIYTVLHINPTDLSTSSRLG